MTKKICILIFFISISVIGQNSKNLRVVEIDSLISLIPINPAKNDEFSQIQSSGLISKKSWIFFNKTIGSFNQDVIYKDNLLYLIKIYTENKNDAINEFYYYENGKLIKYKKKLSDIENETNCEIYSVYIQNDSILGGTKYEVLDIKKILNFSTIKYKSWSGFVNRNE